MLMTKENGNVYLDESPGIDACELDLIHDLGRRLTCLWGYDRCIANAEGLTELQDYWRGVKSQEQRNVERLKNLMKQYAQTNGS